jgi:hypothetical protein
LVDEHWRTGSPLGPLPLERLTSLTPGMLHDLALDLGLTPPAVAEMERGWGPWWDAAAPAMDDWQRQALIAAMDRWPPLAVVELAVKDDYRQELSELRRSRRLFY